MRIKLLLGLFFAIALVMMYSVVQSFSSGAPAGRVNDPISPATCQNGCHMTNALNSGEGTPSLFSNIPEEGYTPGSTYTVTARIEESGFPRFGFQVLAFSSELADGIGSVTITEGDRTQIMESAGRQYVTHRISGVDSINSNTWTFDWTAPEEGVGEVIFYASFLSANGNGSNAGDFVYSTTDTVVQSLSTPLLEDILTHLDVYAVPNRDEIRIEMGTPSPMNIGIGIRDLQGRLLYQSLEIIGSGNHMQQIAAPWNQGIYVVSLQSPLGEQHIKILLQ
ncbi:MAG: Reeler domain-containing protein [Bacteroidota bacterium]